MTTITMWKINTFTSGGWGKRDVTKAKKPEISAHSSGDQLRVGVDNRHDGH